MLDNVQASNNEQALRHIYQPLHPSVRPRLNPEYIAFHDEYMQYVPRDESKAWDGTARTVPSLPPGGSTPCTVREVRDIEIEYLAARAFVPEGEPEKGGWPVLVWFHGGGWAIGGVGHENDFCSLLCREARCVVITVGYRLAPEHPYPAAVLDAVAALRWVCSAGKSQFNLDTTRISLGGASAGGNLATVLALKAAEDSLQIPIKFLLLVVPVIDNTATADTEKDVWWPNRHAPWLTPTRMIWYRRMYMPNEEDWKNWNASPNLAPDELIAKLPRTYMAVSELDLLAPEALAFAKRVRESGVVVETNVIEGGTHSILGLNGVLRKGREMMRCAARALKEGLGV